jgi:serine/threonine protein kinase
MTRPRPFGQYFILEKIAQGGMAEIFKGLTYDFSGLKKFIVIKRILPHVAANQEFIRMLIDEAKIAVRLSHGNIAQTYDLGKVADDYFIVMEFVPGKTISQMFKKSVAGQKNLSIPISAYIISEICHGLDYIHRRQDDSGKPLGIVHCDISPQNVIVSPSGTVKIVDFGVAKAAFKLSESGGAVLKGKFAYMSPEQTEGVFVEDTSDIFSTGVVLWEMLTGRRLFKRKINSETIEAVRHMTVYPPSAYRNEIPSELDEIVMKALERDPARRYSHASDMGLALTKFNLKHFPGFKPVEIGEFLEGLFQDEENTGDIFQEKTQHEEATVREGARQKVVRKEPTSAQEDTLIIDPQELDFHSLFDEIEVEDTSEVTRPFEHDLEASETRHPEDTTGDLPALTREPPSGHFAELLEKSPLTSPDLPRNVGDRSVIKGMVLLGIILLGIFLYVLLLKSQ